MMTVGVARRAGAMAAVLALLLAGGSAGAAGYADGVRMVFVSALDSTRVTVVDSRDDRVAGGFDMGLVPAQLEATGESGRLLAVDGRSPRVALAVLESGAVTSVALDFVPTRLAVGGDGAQVVAASPATGRLAVIDVRAATVTASDNRTPFSDLSAAGDRLVLAPDNGLHILDLATLRPVAQVPGPAFVSLARSPNGRLVYARARDAATVAAVDVRAARLVGEVASAAPRAYTNAIGITLVLPETDTVTVVPSSLAGGVRLRGEAAVTGVYSGWFDTVAFLPSAAGRRVMVVDQPTATRGDDIVLGAVPGRGTVTPDGRKLYLPLLDTNRVAVIDAEKRALAGYVTLPDRPSMALMARTFGICH